MKKSKIKIGLLWHSLTSDNLGVGALTESQIAICTAAAKRAGIDIGFTIIGTSGGRVPTLSDVEIQQGNSVSIRRTILGNAPYLDDIEQCDLVLDIGEGDSFTDIYGLYRFAFLWGSKVGVLMRKRPLILSPQTIGPFNSVITRFLAAQVMKRCEKVFTRDELSTSYLDDAGVKSNRSEAIDVAFRLPYKTPEPNISDSINIGLNISGLLMSGGYTGANQFGLTVNYEELIEKLLEKWTSDQRNIVWLVSHVTPENMDSENDMVSILQVQKKFPNCRVVPKFESPSAAKSFIAGMDFFTGARMHACIAAISSGVPVVPLSYSRKFNGLFNTLAYPWIADGKVDTTELAVEKILNGFENRERLKVDALKAKTSADLKLKAYEDFLVDYFSTIASKR